MGWVNIMLLLENKILVVYLFRPPILIHFLFHHLMKKVNMVCEDQKNSIIKLKRYTKK